MARRCHRRDRRLHVHVHPAHPAGRSGRVLHHPHQRRADPLHQGHVQAADREEARAGRALHLVVPGAHGLHGKPRGHGQHRRRGNGHRHGRPGRRVLDVAHGPGGRGVGLRRVHARPDLEGARHRRRVPRRPGLLYPSGARQPQARRAVQRAAHLVLRVRLQRPAGVQRMQRA